MFIIETVAVGIALGLAILSLAFQEAQTEGKNPWAKALPCLRKKVWWFPKEITGYHIGLVSYTVMLVWLAVTAYTLVLKNYGITIPEGLFATLRFALASLIVLLSVFEDYTWHIVNFVKDEKGFYIYGIHTYLKRKYQAMGGIYILFMPIEYYFAVFISFVFAYLANLVIYWLVIIAVLTIMIGMATVISTAYKQEQEALQAS